MKKLFIPVVIVLLLCGCRTLQTAVGTLESIDLTGDYWQELSCEWTPARPDSERGKPRMNRNVIGRKLIVNNIPYEKGIGVAGKSILICSPDSYASKFELMAGIDDASPAKNATAHLAVFGDGKPLFSTELTGGRDPVHCRIRATGVDELIITIDAPTNVYVDLLLPVFSGAPGLEYELTTGKDSYENYIYAQPKPLKGVKHLFNNAIAFPYKSKKYGNCIGMSNANVCIIVSPGNAGKVIHFGADTKEDLLGGTSGVMLHPLERRIADITLAYQGTWNWKFDSDGMLKLISPPDLAHGIRWMRTFYIVPSTRMLKTSVRIKNVTRDDVSWSAGIYYDFNTNSAIAMRAENSPPGYTFQKAPPENLIVSDNMLLLSDYKTQIIGKTVKNYDVITDAESWFCALSLKTKNAFMVDPVAPKIGLFPYGGARVFVVRTPDNFRVTTLSELTPLGPNESFSQTQYWIIGQGVKDMKTTVSELKSEIKDSLSADSGYGVPTGRTINNY